MYPKPFMELSGWKVRDISCGPLTFAVAAEESTITWGQATNLELAYGPSGKKTSANPEKVDALEGCKTYQVCCGIAHTLFVIDPKSSVMKDLPIYKPDEADLSQPSGNAAKKTKGSKDAKLPPKKKPKAKK